MPRRKRTRNFRPYSLVIEFLHAVCIHTPHLNLLSYFYFSLPFTFCILLGCSVYYRFFSCMYSLMPALTLYVCSTDSLTKNKGTLSPNSLKMELKNGNDFERSHGYTLCVLVQYRASRFYFFYL